MLVIFVVLLAAPLVIRDLQSINKSIRLALWNAIGPNGKSTIALLQPLDQGLNDTTHWYTGSHLPEGWSAHPSITPTGGSWSFARMI